MTAGTPLLTITRLRPELPPAVLYYISNPYAGVPEPHVLVREDVALMVYIRFHAEPPGKMIRLRWVVTDPKGGIRTRLRTRLVPRRATSGRLARYFTYYAAKWPGPYRVQLTVIATGRTYSADRYFAAAPGVGHLGTTFQLPRGLTVGLTGTHPTLCIQRYHTPLIHAAAGTEFIIATWFARNAVHIGVRPGTTPPIIIGGHRIAPAYTSFGLAPTPPVLSPGDVSGFVGIYTVPRQRARVSFRIGLARWTVMVDRARGCRL